MFLEYKRSRERRRVETPSSAAAMYSFALLKQTKFYIPMLLVGTFIVFMVVPDMVMLFYGILGETISETLTVSCSISYTISSIADGVIYIFLQPAVMSLLKTSIGKLIDASGFMMVAESETTSSTGYTTQSPKLNTRQSNQTPNIQQISELTNKRQSIQLHTIQPSSSTQMPNPLTD